MSHWKGNEIYEAKVNTEAATAAVREQVCLHYSLSLSHSLLLSLSRCVYPLSHKIHDKSNMLISF